jgi:hypothetical protein
LQNVGGLECFGACLSEKKKADGQGTQATPHHWLLLMVPAPPAPPLVDAPPNLAPRTLAESLLLAHLLHEYAQDEYHVCIRDGVTC